MSINFPNQNTIQVQTLNDNSIDKERDFIICFFENWTGNFLHPYGDDLLDFELLNSSLFYCYLAHQSAVLDWIIFSLMNGAYEVVKRELRTMLEGVFLVYKIETENNSLSLKDKLIKLEALESNRKSHGKFIFEKSNYANWNSYYLAYSKLNKHVHLSFQNIEKIAQTIKTAGFPEINDFNYDRVEFLACYNYLHQIATLCVDMANQIIIVNSRISIQTPLVFHQT